MILNFHKFAFSTLEARMYIHILFHIYYLFCLHFSVVHRKSLLDERTVEESASGTEEEEQAVIPNLTDYTEIFRPNRACK